MSEIMKIHPKIQIPYNQPITRNSKCGRVTNLRTFYEGYLKRVELYNWLRENRNFYII